MPSAACGIAGNAIVGIGDQIPLNICQGFRSGI